MKLCDAPTMQPPSVTTACILLSYILVPVSTLLAPVPTYFLTISFTHFPANSCTHLSTISSAQLLIPVPNFSLASSISITPKILKSFTNSYSFAPSL